MSEKDVMEEEQRLCEEFLYLLDRGNTLLAGLRDLSDFGTSWETYFHRCFEIYARLWKFQQQHRAVLEKKELYGLQRWEIGEIASKIGQLYYHYYLRTSDTAFLQEAYLFYDAIRSRQYFKGIIKIRSPALLVKELRYYARFVVVCLLLERQKTARELVGELTHIITDYARYLSASEAQEWQLVLQEITLFLQADAPIMVKDIPDFSFAHRRLPTRSRSPVAKKPILGTVILCCSRNQLVKFSELSLDGFRMMLAFENEIASPNQPKSEKPSPNPSKYILYRPTVSTLLQYVASAQKEARENSALVLYVSADGEKGFSMRSGSDPHPRPYSKGGIMLRPEAKPETPASGLYVSKDCLYSDDLLPFLRRPLLFIIDSDNSGSFTSLSSTIFGAPILVLASPHRSLPGLLEPEQAGSLFSFFLSDPVSAFCFTISRSVMTAQYYDELQSIATSMFEKLNNSISTMSDLPMAFSFFSQDDYLRNIICRFVFASTVLSCYVGKGEPTPAHIPKSQPKAPNQLLQHDSVIVGIKALAAKLGALSEFKFDLPIAGAPPQHSTK
eukprot:TRINITY_DN1258_c0_g1_i2.p1 TRINITY_DN1258_c0_g1~~TRINITY_DN1258_c0_g1_i2.p1  ORF type:complete len:557 (+),score=65.32 TRINITY_DN1258_c0_g1_i2:77-1747(+)